MTIQVYILMQIIAIKKRMPVSTSAEAHCIIKALRVSVEPTGIIELTTLFPQIVSDYET